MKSTQLIYQTTYYLLVCFLFILPGCQQEKEMPSADGSLFTLLEAERTGIDFANNLKVDVYSEYNSLSYEPFYNGSGVAIGDINNDGLSDVFFSGNMTNNRLYLNKGNMTFEDISEKAGLGNNDWGAGVTMADVNGDGWLDIYVCQSGPEEDKERRRNLLFLNNQDLTFTESAQVFGLDDGNRSTQAAFFDYDQDGDLDCYVMNESKYFRIIYDAVFKDLQRPGAMEEASGHLYRNDGNTFTKVTQEAGLLRYGFGLGLCVSDINQDGLPDIYVANDYSVPDFMYINNGDGTFTDQIKTMTRQVPFYSMGCDIADINNDGYPEIAAVDMATSDHYRGKTLMASMDVEAFYYFVDELGYQTQYMFNVFQLNNGNNTFSNIANIAGLSKTEWSWAAILADFDLDGYKDFFVTNGIRHNARNNDFRVMMENVRNAHGGTVPDSMKEELYAQMPEINLNNLIYKNNGDLTFSNSTEKWGLAQPAYSHAAVYGDLDNDGDLDLIVSNTDAKAFVYQNNAADRKEGNHLKIKLVGKNKKSPTLLAKAKLYIGKETQYQELITTKGYQGAVEPIFHFGLGYAEKVDKIEIEWPDGTMQTLENVKANQLLTVAYAPDGPTKLNASQNQGTTFAMLNPTSTSLEFAHKENAFNDFEKEVLLPHRQSTLGPNISVGDANSDGLEDCFVGGAANQAGQLFLQGQNGKFSTLSGPWENHKAAEDMGSLFFDADGDGDNDLYVVSGGGGEFAPEDPILQDRLYINDGKGKFTFKPSALPAMYSSGMRVKAADYDGDNDLDLFIGGAAVPGRYPYPSRSFLLQNQGGSFKDVTENVAPELASVGMVKDQLWTDINQDGAMDLIVVGEWMPISIFINENGQFTNQSQLYGTDELKGWWYSIKETDVDGDGDQDLVVGNVGLNTKFSTSPEKRFKVYASDFDQNGSNDIVLSKKYKGRYVPSRGRECSSEQMPFIKDKFPTYDGFANADLSEILGEENLKSSLELDVTTFASMVLINEGAKAFKTMPLPNLAQISPINDIVVYDFNADKIPDLLIAGNTYNTEVETPRYDAGSGLLLLGYGDGRFEPTPITQSGFYAPLNVKDLALINTAVPGFQLILVANNNQELQVYINKKTS